MLVQDVSKGLGQSRHRMFYVLFSWLLLADGEWGGRGVVRPLEVHPPGVPRGADLAAELAGDALLNVTLNVILNHLTNERPGYTMLLTNERASLPALWGSRIHNQRSDTYCRIWLFSSRLLHLVHPLTFVMTLKERFWRLLWNFIIQAGSLFYFIYLSTIFIISDGGMLRYVFWESLWFWIPSHKTDTGSLGG